MIKLDLDLTFDSDSSEVTSNAVEIQEPLNNTPIVSLTFTATAEVVEYLGGRVHLVDVDPETGLLTPEIVADALEAHPSISCVMPVHFAGRA